MILSDASRALGGKVDFYAGVHLDPSKINMCNILFAVNDGLHKVDQHDTLLYRLLG